jgi:hypothetical protein
MKKSIAFIAVTCCLLNGGLLNTLIDNDFEAGERHLALLR